MIELIRLLFNELDHTLDKYLIDINLKYDMVSNEIQVENNNNERNLDIYQSTSEIIQRNIMSSTEEIQALISQIYANTTIIIHTGDSLEYANKAKYKLKIAKKSMEIIDSADPLSLINGLFDNMPFNDENIDKPGTKILNGFPKTPKPQKDEKRYCKV